jgi:hypothetical protein
MAEGWAFWGFNGCGLRTLLCCDISDERKFLAECLDGSRAGAGLWAILGSLSETDLLEVRGCKDWFTMWMCRRGGVVACERRLWCRKAAGSRRIAVKALESSTIKEIRSSRIFNHQSEKIKRQNPCTLAKRSQPLSIKPC